MRTALGLDTTLDVDRLQVTHHAVLRYQERRHGRCTAAEAVAAIRRLLRAAASQRPGVYCANGDPVRRYTAGGFAFIVSGDHSTLITVYPWRDRRRAQSTPRGRKPRRWELADWGWDDE